MPGVRLWVALPASRFGAIFCKGHYTLSLFFAKRCSAFILKGVFYYGKNQQAKKEKKRIGSYP